MTSELNELEPFAQWNARDRGRKSPAPFLVAFRVSRVSIEETVLFSANTWRSWAHCHDSEQRDLS
jgi:hypothetical protein